MTREEIVELFTHHPPLADQVDRYRNIRLYGQELALLIDKSCSDSREKSLAITSVQQAVMWANAAIAIHEEEKKKK
jgi:hypothetical protein